MQPLVLQNQMPGQRHYFDCYESAFGGLLAFHHGNVKAILNLYSIVDSLSLTIDPKTGGIILKSRALDINNLVMNALGYELVELKKIKTLFNHYKKNKIFITVFDEFFVKENNNYLKKHFSHASLTYGITNKDTLQVMDPVLKITKDGNSFDKRIITFDTKIFTLDRAILFYFMKKKDGKTYISNQYLHKLYEKFSQINLDIWNNTISNNSNSNYYYYGLESFIVFTNSLKDLSCVEQAATEFYKWIFPIYWKREYLKSFNKEINTKIIHILNKIISEMEIFETNLLRLTAFRKEKLYFATISRWERIIILFKKYISLEKIRVDEF